MLLKSNHIESSISNLYEEGFAPKDNAKGYEYYAYMQGKRDLVDSFKKESVNDNYSIKADAFLEKVHRSYFLSNLIEGEDKGNEDNLIFPLGSNAYGVTVAQYMDYDNIDSVEAGFKPRGIFGKGEYFTSVNAEDAKIIDYPYTLGDNKYYKEFPYFYKGVSSFCSRNQNLLPSITPSPVKDTAVIEEIKNSGMFISSKVYELKKDLSRVKTTEDVEVKLGSATLSAGNYILSFFCKTKGDFTVTMGNTSIEANSDLKSGCYERFVGCFSIDGDSKDINFTIRYVGPIRIAGILLEQTDAGMPSPYYKAYHEPIDDNGTFAEFDRKSPLAFSNAKKGTVTIVNFKRELDIGNNDCESREYICGYKVITRNPRKFENVFAIVDRDKSLTDSLWLLRFDESGKAIDDGEVIIEEAGNISVVSNGKDCDIDLILGGIDLEKSHPGYYRDLIIYNNILTDRGSVEALIEVSMNSLFEVAIVERGTESIAAVKSPLIFEGINR